MKKKSFAIAEIAGIFVVTGGVIFLWNLYALSEKATLGVVFGAVNSSVWEKTKGISIVWILFGLTELMCTKPFFRNFAVAKTLGLCVSLLIFMIFDSFFKNEMINDIIVLCAAVACGFLCSYFFTVSNVCLRPYFAPACFLLMLIFMMTFSFTAFAPKLPLFRDPYTGCYGIIPESFDQGAVALGI